MLASSVGGIGGVPADGPRTAGEEPGHSFTDTELDVMRKFSTHRKYDPGDLIYQQGDRGDSRMFVVVKGSVRLDKRHAKVLRILAYVAPGSAFGEGALLLDRSHTVSARAVEATECIEIDRERYRRMRTENPWIALRIMETLLATVLGRLDHADVRMGASGITYAEVREMSGEATP